MIGLGILVDYGVFKNFVEIVGYKDFYVGFVLKLFDEGYRIELFMNGWLDDECLLRDLLLDLRILGFVLELVLVVGLVGRFEELVRYIGFLDGMIVYCFYVNIVVYL